MTTVEEARETVCKTGMRLVELGLVPGTWGNVSLRIDNERMAITPSGLDYGNITPEDIVLVNLRDGTYEGPKPSNEKRLHGAIYLARKEVNAVIHTHSPNASTVAAARREVPPILEDLVQIAGPTVRVTEYAIASTRKAAKNAVKALVGRSAVLLANHGAVCVGRTMEEAVTCCQVLEKGCRSFIEAEFLGGAKSINRFEAALMRQYYLRIYSKQR
ncbi:MAG TPA: class II aldolase/adducin family protein [Candidatus Bathyarchaeia archaeon]|nr:class II aldolase/adducin family protein [Candidatus Bathyarchaeia archaeon]